MGSICPIHHHLILTLSKNYTHFVVQQEVRSDRDVDHKANYNVHCTCDCYVWVWSISHLACWYACVQINNRELLHAVIALYAVSLSEMTPDTLYASVCEKWARTIVLLRDVNGENMAVLWIWLHHQCTCWCEYWYIANSVKHKWCVQYSVYCCRNWWLITQLI